MSSGADIADVRVCFRYGLRGWSAPVIGGGLLLLLLLFLFLLLLLLLLQALTQRLLLVVVEPPSSQIFKYGSFSVSCRQEQEAAGWTVMKRMKDGEVGPAHTLLLRPGL